MTRLSAHTAFSLILLLAGSAVADAQTAPFRVAVIGDSVMWGQGLHPLQKFSTTVQQHLQNNLGGRSVSLVKPAHSGARIGFSNPADLDGYWASQAINGEVPLGFPTVAYQAAFQVPDPAGVDLVLMDGGITDVDIPQIMDLNISPECLRGLVRTNLGQRMTGLLRDVVVPTFPNATIVVTNYYPVISEESSPTFIVGVFKYTLGTIVADGWAQTYRPQLAERWRVFHEESTRVIREAALEANRYHATQRVHFVDAGFGPANAVGASSPWLYGPDDIDPVDYLRHELCDTHQPDWVQRQICYRANTGHPNRFGAAAYSSAIIREISPLIPGWRATNTPGTLALQVVTNVMASTSLTITVYATDAITAAPLSGTVTIQGKTAPTGSRITYRRCLSQEDGKIPYAPCPGTVSVTGYTEAEFAR